MTWFATDYKYRQKIYIDNVDGIAETNGFYPIKIDSSSNLRLFNLAQSDGDDIRFFDNAGNELSYWKNKYITNSETCWIWIKLSSLIVGSNGIWVYYGNTGASDQSDGWTDIASKRHYTDSNCFACYHMDHHNMQALEFDGGDEHVDCGSDSSIDDFTNMTFCCWFYTDGSGESGSETIMSKISGLGGTGRWLYFDDTNDYIYYYQSGSVSSGGWSTPASSITLSKWTHVAITFDASTTPVMYINGTSVTVTTASSLDTPDADAGYNLWLGDDNSDSTCLSGKLSDVRYFNTELTAAQILQVMRGEIVATSNLKLWLDFEYINGTTVYDLSGNGNNGTITGAAATGVFLADCPTCGSGSYHGDFRASREPLNVGCDGVKFGSNKSMWFDESDDYIENGTYLDSMPSSFVFSCWFSFDSTFDSGAGSDQELMCKQNVVNDDRIWIFFDQGTGSLRFGTEENANGNNYVDSTTTSWTGGRWYHVVCTWDTTNGKRLFINDNLENSDAAETTLMADGTNTDFYVGIFWDESSAPFGGRIAEIVTYHEELSTTDITNIYNGNYLDAGTPQLYWNFKQYSSPTVSDQSGNDWDGTVTGAILSIGDYPFTGNNVLNFDGTDDYAHNTTLLDTVPSDISISFWFKLNETFATGASGDFDIINKYNDSTDDMLRIVLDATDGKLDFDTEENGNGVQSLSSTTASWSSNEWYNVCVIWDTTNGKRIFVNGILEAIDTGETTLMANGIENDFIIGKHYSNVNYLDGIVDDIRVWETSLTGLEVKQVTNGDTTVQSGNLLAYYRMQSDYADSKAISFDGTNDYFYNGTYLDTVPAAIAVAMWFKPGVSWPHSGSECLFCKLNTGLNAMYPYFYNGTLRFITQANSSESILNDGSTWSSDTWYHVIFTWDGTNGKRIIVNGSVSASDGTKTTLMSNGSSSDFVVGAYGTKGANFYNGQIADVVTYHEILDATDIANIYDGDYYASCTPIVLWNFRNSSTDTVYDQSGNSWDGTISGAVKTTWEEDVLLGDASGNNYDIDMIGCSIISDDINIYDGNTLGSEILNGALEFDSGNDRVDLGALDLSGQTTGSISAWVYFEDDSEQYVFHYYVDGTNEMRFFFDQSANDFKLAIIDGGVADVWIETDSEPAPNMWHHIVGTQDGSTPKLYLDGVLQSSSGGTKGGDWFDDIGASANTYIGGDNSATYAVNGRVDELRLYNKALTAEEVQALYEGGRGGAVTEDQVEGQAKLFKDGFDNVRGSYR